MLERSQHDMMPSSRVRAKERESRNNKSHQKTHSARSARKKSSTTRHRVNYNYDTDYRPEKTLSTEQQPYNRFLDVDDHNISAGFPDYV